MCLAIPVKIIKITKNIADVSSGGVKRKADIRMVPGVKPGDYVLLHAGFAIERLDKKEAEKTLALFNEISERNENK